MSVFKNAYLENEIKRWTAPNAHHFVRPDWRRHVTSGSDLSSVLELYERKYRPDQPRVPDGSPEAGSGRMTVHQVVLLETKRLSLVRKVGKEAKGIMNFRKRFTGIFLFPKRRAKYLMRQPRGRFRREAIDGMKHIGNTALRSGS